MFESIACGASRKMASYLNWNEVEEAEFYLGMKVLLHNVRMIAGIALLSLFMGVFWESCFVFSVFGFLRLKAGGFHCKESWQCFSLTSSIVIGGALAAWGMESMSIVQIIGIYVILCVLACMIAPQGTENRPISCAMQRKRKRETIMCLIVYMFLAIILKNTAGKFIIVASMLEMVSLVPSVIMNKFPASA